MVKHEEKHVGFVFPSHSWDKEREKLEMCVLSYLWELGRV